MANDTRLLIKKGERDSRAKVAKLFKGVSAACLAGFLRFRQELSSPDFR